MPSERCTPNELILGLVSISDRASRGEYQDEGLPALRTWCEDAIISPVQYHERLIADDRYTIEETLRELVDRIGCDLVLTTGGTGPALRDVTPEAVEEGRRYIDEKRISISLKEAIEEKLYIEVEAAAAGHRAVAVIAGGHTRFVYVERDGEVLLDLRSPSADEEEEGEVPLTLRRVWDFALTAPLDEIRFILETSRLNKAAAEPTVSLRGCSPIPPQRATPAWQGR